MKTTRRFLSLILAVVMLFSVSALSVVADETDMTLTDIDITTTVGKAVNRLVSMGIINGYPDGTYRPDNTITRAEFCVVMVKFEGMQDFINPEALTGFEDLDTDANYAWARPYVAMAVQRGVISGFEDKTFRAADPVTYEQALKMLVCSLGYGNTASYPTIDGDWSSGYVAKAMDLKVTSGTLSYLGTKTKPTTRGTVAILVSNALDATKNDIVTDSGVEIMGGNQASDDLGYTEVKGIVTGTYLTEIDTAKSSVPKNHIQIDDEIYEIGFSADPNEFLGCEVKAIVKESETGDEPVASNLTVTSKTNTLEISADLLGEYADGILEYQQKRGSKVKEAKIAEEPTVIFNNKFYEYDLDNLKQDLKNGNVVLVDNNGDSRYDVVRINSYEVYVVSSKNTSSQKITLMYGAEHEDAPTIIFPDDSTSLIFSLTRNGKEITINDIAKWDVLNIKASPEDAEGRQYYEVIVTRETVSGMITEVDEDDESCITIGNTDYYIADSYLEYTGEDKAELKIGEYAQVYLDAEGKIVAAAEAKSDVSSEQYGYLYALRQNTSTTTTTESENEYDLEFKIYTTAGKMIQVGTSTRITIDGTRYKTDDEAIKDYLAGTAEEANKYAPGAENVGYRQLIIYQTNSAGLVTAIDTVKSAENSDISAAMNDEGDYFAPYKERTYKSSSKSFSEGGTTDFKVSSSTKIIYVPDDRSDSDGYITFTSYSKAFANSRDYHVEAYGLTSSKTASVVLIYVQNDYEIYTSSTPFMIVASKTETADGAVIKGYNGTSYSLKSLTVEEGLPVSAIGKGDIIRYLTNTEGHISDYVVWFDASDPTQLTPVSDVDDVYDVYENDKDPDEDGNGIKRILEIHSSSTEPKWPGNYKGGYPSATLRLQYGTVTEIVVNAEGEESIDEESITVSPFIVEDGVDIIPEDDTGYVSRNIGSSVKVFSYDRSGRGSDVVTDASLEDILSYVEYGEDATRVITYSASGTLRMIYIIED